MIEELGRRKRYLINKYWDIEISLCKIAVKYNMRVAEMLYNIRSLSYKDKIKADKLVKHKKQLLASLSEINKHIRFIKGV